MENIVVPDNTADVSKRTVLILLVLTIVVTAMGVWTVLDRMEYQKVPQYSSSTGQLSLMILPSENNLSGNEQSPNP